MEIRIKYIDVLKAFAILAVVLYHIGVLEYGYLGVDIFLVINGFLITRSLIAKVLVGRGLDTSETKNYFTFEISRLIRLLPPLLVAGTTCMLIGFFTMLPDDYENLSESVIATSFFCNNILAAITTKNYWDVVNEYKPLMHTWYVGVVMQFYIIYPILFYIAKFDKKAPNRTLLTILSILALISLLIYFGGSNYVERFYYLPSRFFEFAVGGIVAVIYQPNENKPFCRGLVYFCYIFLIVLILINVDIIPANIKLVIVVSLSVVLLSSQNILENGFTGNVLLARIGAASYSIFIWHQLLLAFYRYTITNRFTIVSYVIILAVTALLSWMSYKYIEQTVTNNLKNKTGRIYLYYITAFVFIALNAYSGYIYLNAGVVRDIPELYIRKNDVHRGMHAEYVDRGYLYDKPFKTGKRHWLVIGNSFGRDFVNVILESKVADSVEVSYIYFDREINLDFASKYANRFSKADKVFLSTHGINEKAVREVEVICHENGIKRSDLIIVGEKNFGASNGQVYAKRNRRDYFDQYTDVEDYNFYIVRNNHFAELYKERYIDLLGMVSNGNSQVRVFTPDHHFMSADCRHLSKGGAIYYAHRIDWTKYYDR